MLEHCPGPTSFCYGHPEMRSLRTEVLRAIREPSELPHAPRVGEDWYYLQGAGPSQWLKVVIAFDENNNGSVLTGRWQLPGRRQDDSPRARLGVQRG